MFYPTNLSGRNEQNHVILMEIPGLFTHIKKNQ